MKKKKNNKKVSTGTVIAIGAGVAALAAASYYFFGPNGKKNRNSLKGWMIKMKGEIIEKLEASKEVTENLYHQIVDTVAGAYVKKGKISDAEVKLFADTLKKQWKNIAGRQKSKAKKVVKKVRREVKKAINRKAKT